MAATQTLLSDQLELTVGNINIQDDGKENCDEKINEYFPTSCICGNSMLETKVLEYTEKFAICKICGFRYTKTQHEEQQIFICNEENENVLYHPYIVCSLCLKKTKDFNKNPIKDIYKSELLYFIYNNNTMNGPYNIDEIINAYIRKQIKSGEMWIKSAATDKSKWHQLILPNKWNDYKELRFDDEKRLQLIEKYKIKNKKIKQQFPKLYENLVENVMNNRINQIVLPTDIPLNAKKSSKLSVITNIFGTILAVILGIIIILHCVISIIIVGIICILLSGIFSLCGAGNILLKNDYTIYLLYILCLSGMVISPILLIYIILLIDINIDIQSWMIAYIFWGIISWILPTSFIFVLIKQNWKMINIYTKLILLIIGIDFGQWDIDDIGDKQDTLGLFIVLMIFPSLSSVLPSAIAGFIANFILEEKFLLKCNENNNNQSSLCLIEEKNGCCQIVSSHEWENSYAFIGGLASNILAIWAIIRIIGYFIVNSYPSLALFAKRKK